MVNRTIIIVGTTDVGLSAAIISASDKFKNTIVEINDILDSIPTDLSFIEEEPFILTAIDLPELKVFIENKELPKPKITYYGNRYFKNTKYSFDKRKIGRRFYKNAHCKREKKEGANFKTNNT